MSHNFCSIFAVNSYVSNRYPSRKKGTRIVMLKRVYCLATVILSNVFTSSAFSHNGAVAFARPVKNITVDGDLSDWPDGMTLHAIKMAEFGDKPANDQDLSGNFRAGYNAESGMLYVAVLVTDGSRVVHGEPTCDWDSQDGSAIYIDRQQVKNGIHAEQYFQCGNELRMHGAAEGKKTSQVAKLQTSESDGKRIYEWQVPLGKTAVPGSTLGFDVDITDKDEDGSFTWMAWGSGTQKIYFFGRLGLLHLVAEGDPMQLVRVNGNVRLKNQQAGEQLLFPPVLIQSKTSASRWTRVKCDESGKFSTLLPAGTYRISPVDTSELRIDESVSIECKLVPGQDAEADELVVPRAKSPNLIGEIGLLRENTFDPKKLDRFVSVYQRYHHVPGVSLAIIANGKIQYHKKYGVKNSITKAPLQADTVFEGMFAYQAGLCIRRQPVG